MADFSTIKGFTVQSLASDPSNPVEGQVWYNTTSTVLKGYGKQGTGAWASGGTANNSHNIAYAAGTQTATLIWAGGTSGVSSNSNKTGSYNGTAWTELALLGTARRNGGYAGTQTSALCAGGQVPAASTLNESWDGTSWSTESVLTTLTGRGTRAAGTSDSAVLAFGDDSYSAASTLWNGTSWTAQPSMTTSRAYSGPIGTSTSAIATGGYPVSPAQSVNYWDGSTWAEGADMVDGRQYAGACGPNNESGLVFGGDAPGLSALTESYNGTAWTEVADLATAREGVQGGGTAVTAIAGGGYSPDQTVSEEWNVPDAIKTFTAT